MPDDDAGGPSGLRVFLGLQEIAGTYVGLKRGLRARGVHCDFVNLYPHPFDYGDEDPTRLVTWLRRLEGIRPTRWWWRITLVFPVMAMRFLVFLWALPRYDVFVFGYATSFFPREGYWDYALLKACGKRILCRFHGDDSRPPYLSAQCLRPDGTPRSPRECAGLARRRKRALRRIGRYADVIMDNVAHGVFHTKPFVDLLELGQAVPPHNGAEQPSRAAPDADRPVRIFHAPSNPLVKGTERIRQLVKDLQSEGCAIEYREVSGAPNQVVREALAWCDVVIDQLYSDFPMPGLAMEAALFGRPTVLGGYHADRCRAEYDPAVLPPVRYCHPSAVQDALRSLIADPNARTQLGTAAKRFVEGRWSIAEVSARWLRIIRGDIPPEWYRDPASITTLCGGGLDADRLKRVVCQMIAVGGIASLQLRDRPALEEYFRRLCDVEIESGVRGREDD